MHLLPQAKIEFKDSSIQHKNFTDMLPLSPRICQCMRQFFVKRPKFLAATSNNCPLSVPFEFVNSLRPNLARYRTLYILSKSKRINFVNLCKCVYNVIPLFSCFKRYRTLNHCKIVIFKLITLKFAMWTVKQWFYPEME